MLFFPSYNKSVPGVFFRLQQEIAKHLLDLLENDSIEIKRSAAIAGEVLNIIGEDAPASALIDIKQQLAKIPELKSLNLLDFQ